MTKRLLIGLSLYFFTGLAWASAGHGAKKGLMEIDYGLAVWTIVTFGVLLILLKTFAWKPLLEALDAREASIRNALENSEKANKEAKELLEKARKEIADASIEAKKIIDEARNKATRLQDEKLAELEKECARLREQAQNQINQAKQKAMREVVDQLTVLSTEIASKLIDKTLKPEDHAALIDSSLEDIRQRLEA